MSKLEILIKEYCSDGVEYKKIGEALTIARGVRVVKNQLSQAEGFPVYQNSLTPLGYYNKSNCHANKVFIIAAGAAGEVGFCEQDFWAADDCYYFLENNFINERYLYHVLLNLQSLLFSKVRKASIPRLSRQSIESIKIPIPPLAVQSEIVRILDHFTLLTTELTAELTARKKQYEYYKNGILQFNDAPILKIGDITKVFSLPRVFRNQWTKEGVPFLRSSDVIAAYNHIENSRGKAFISYELYSELSKDSEKIGEGDILVTGGGTIGIPYLVDNNDPIFVKDGDLLCIKRNDVLLPKFIYHYFLSYEFRRYLKNITHDATIAHYTITQIENTPIPVPTIEEQNRVVKILDSFEKLCNGITSGLPAEISARKKQYEYYRDKLLTFKAIEGIKN